MGININNSEGNYQLLPALFLKLNNMKTALQEAIEKFEHALSYNVEGGICWPYSWTALSNDLYKLLEKEKQQIIDAYLQGETDVYADTFNNAEEYYNKKFKQ